MSKGPAEEAGQSEGTGQFKQPGRHRLRDRFTAMRPRNSTVLLTVLFLGVLALWILVRPVPTLSQTSGADTGQSGSQQTQQHPYVPPAPTPTQTPTRTPSPHPTTTRPTTPTSTPSVTPSPGQSPPATSSPTAPSAPGSGNPTAAPTGGSTGAGTGTGGGAGVPGAAVTAPTPLSGCLPCYLPAARRRASRRG